LLFCYNLRMEKDLLSEVIEVEKEIQKCLELEKVASREWLEQTKKEFEDEFAGNAKTVEGSLQQVIDDAQKAAEVNASAIVAQATRRAGLVQALNTETLSKIVQKHISALLPG